MAGHKSSFTLLDLFDGLICDEFQFRKQGISSNYCISKPFLLHVPKGAADIPNFEPGAESMDALIKANPKTPVIAIHLNFRCTVSVRGDVLNLAIAAFHLTARPAKGQSLIDEAGPSQLTALESIHINQNTGWGRPDNIAELLRVLDAPSQEDLFHVLNYHFSQKAVKGLVVEWGKNIGIKATFNSRIDKITFDGSDRSFNEKDVNSALSKWPEDQKKLLQL